MSSRRTIPHRWRLGSMVVLMLAALILGLGGASASGVTGPGPGLADCGPGRNSAPVAELDVPNGAAILEHIPHSAVTPEITDPKGPLHDGPLHLILYAGVVCGLPVIGPIPDPSLPAPVYRDVLIVVRPDGDAWYLGEVDFTGFKS